MGNRKYTDEQYLKAAQLRDIGVGPKDIADQVGCPIGGVEYCVARGRALMEKEDREESAWWRGLSEKTAKELLRRGYQDREDTAAFVSERPVFVGQSERGRRALYDPLQVARPWLREGLPPMRISLEMYNEVRNWLGAEPIPPKKST